ncbi:MAG: hypothetical protein WAW96_09420 [Alphaproteobacteria bacterium]
MPGAFQAPAGTPIPKLTAPGRAFYDVYKSLQRENGCLVPPRKSLTLPASKPFAPYLSILEMREPYTAIVRLTGTANVNRTRLDNTGKNWFDMFPAETRADIWGAFRLILDTPRGSLVFAHEEYQRAIAIEVLTFPFADNHGVPNYIVSTTTQLQLKDLTLRGDDAMRPSMPDAEYFIDIGAGSGPPV